MDRTIPRTDSETIDLYVRTYYSLLRSSTEIAIETLVESHVGMNSLLHPHAGQQSPDVPALTYAALRLPPEIANTQLVLLGQRSAVFERWGYDIEDWSEVAAPARRRRAYFDGQSTMAMYIASRSDIDDVLPILTAYQIEWNKLHRLLEDGSLPDLLLEYEALTNEQRQQIATQINITLEELILLENAWGEDFVPTLQSICDKPKRMYLRLLAGTLTDYRKATHYWWEHIESATPDIDYSAQRVYFVSSNMHSFLNMWSGFALQQKEALIAYLHEDGQEDLLQAYHEIEKTSVPSSRENFLYFVLKQYLNQNQDDVIRQHNNESLTGVHHVPSEHGFDIGAQVFEIGKLNADWIDPRVCLGGIELLKDSNALLINIDYPLGMGAYEILTRISENVGELCGIYIMGKAATLNGRVGDVMIPTVVHDEHSTNTYLFQNCFTAADVAPYLAYGNVLDNQKSVTVRGTFLQNQRFMSVFYSEGYTDIEMEAGPYLSAIYEMTRPKRHPYNEIVSLYPVQFFDVGIIHYASDKPLSRGQNLGAGSLSYRGMDSTYAAAVAILRHIIQREIQQQTL